MLQKILSALKNTASDTPKTRTQLIKQCKADTDLHEFDLQLAVLIAGVPIYFIWRALYPAARS